MRHYIFDVDGTLTPSRQNIDDEFHRWFYDFCLDNKVYLVTGSDYAKTLEQLGPSICNNVTKVYNCCGADVWHNGVNIHTNPWTSSLLLKEFLTECLTESSFPYRTGFHFDNRPGMLNFSVVGRNATLAQRKEYFEWDKENKERAKLSKLINDIFVDVQCRVGGETGVDIFPKGGDKSQILKDFDAKDELYFFGDRMESDGNDYPLAQSIIDSQLGMCYHVKDWQHTHQLLRELWKK